MTQMVFETPLVKQAVHTERFEMSGGLRAHTVMPGMGVRERSKSDRWALLGLLSIVPISKI